MAFLAVLLVSLLLGYRGWVVLQRRRIHAVLLLVLAFYGLSFAATYDAYELAYGATAQTAAGVFTAGALLLVASLHVFSRLCARSLARAPATWARRFERYSARHLRYAAVFLFVSLFLFLAFRQDFGATWEESREGTGVMLVLAPFFMFLGCPGLVSAYRSSKPVFAAYLLLVVSVFVFSGSRAGVLTAMAMFAWSWLSSRPGGRLSLNPKAIASFAAIAAGVFVVHAVLRGLRSFSPADMYAMLAAGNFGGVLSAIGEATGGAGLAGSESSIIDYFVFAVHTADESVYGFLTTVQRLLTLFMPGSFFPEKPMDVSYRLWADAWLYGLFDDSPYRDALAGMYESGAYGSLHPTLFGELFLSGRWVGLGVSVVFVAALCVLIEWALLRMRHLDAMLLLGPSMVGMAMIARGNTVIGFGYFFYLLPIVLLSTWSVRALKRFLAETRSPPPATRSPG